MKKAPKKVKKSCEITKKYQEEWAMIPENYLLKTPSAKQLETRRRRIDLVYDIHKSIKKYNKKQHFHQKKWQYPPEFSSAYSLLLAIKDMKRELKYLEKQKRDAEKMKKVIKVTVKQKHANIPKNITVKKKRRKRCPNGMDETLKQENVLNLQKKFNQKIN